MVNLLLLVMLLPGSCYAEDHGSDGSEALDGASASSSIAETDNSFSKSPPPADPGTSPLATDPDRERQRYLEDLQKRGSAASPSPEQLPSPQVEWNPDELRARREAAEHVTALDDEDYEERQRAAAALKKMVQDAQVGYAVADALPNPNSKALSLEQRRRLKDIVPNLAPEGAQTAIRDKVAKEGEELKKAASPYEPLLQAAFQKFRDGLKRIDRDGRVLIGGAKLGELAKALESGLRGQKDKNIQVERSSVSVTLPSPQGRLRIDISPYVGTNSVQKVDAQGRAIPLTLSPGSEVGWAWSRANGLPAEKTLSVGTVSYFPNIRDSRGNRSSKLWLDTKSNPWAERALRESDWAPSKPYETVFTFPAP